MTEHVPPLKIGTFPKTIIINVKMKKNSVEKICKFEWVPDEIYL